MKQGDEQCWMWMMKKRPSSSQLLRSHFEVSMECLTDTWEEQAFAEDAARCLRGCIWPPRSYSCSFCNREFRSAQALGGHMNVHRRDRARLKQSLHGHHQYPNNEAAASKPKPQVDESACTLDHSIDYSTATKRALNDVETSLSVGLSSVLFQNRPAVTCNKEAANNKRPKVAVSTLQCSPLEWQVLELKPASSVEDLDLELKLGVL
ncbi:hypothetical protein ES288_A10G273600v1 [Gossypium darwinii]|uniref:C2H2-type domain-containing protein n=1 Tax=Gossypium darwinii TaxID=34276 RepID=A0A5D2F5C9_GOSDA|nr:hypothetical protein ES288_A10G273600v1 [Gossypium darwinii]